MKIEIRYIELKTGYSDDGPAWIGKVKLSKSGQTIYFNDRAFRKMQGTYGNYYDIETNEEYWISRVKKEGTDRHWAGKGKVFLDKSIIQEYLDLTGQKVVDNNKFKLTVIPDVYPLERINKLENQTIQEFQLKYYLFEQQNLIIIPLNQDVTFYSWSFKPLLRWGKKTNNAVAEQVEAVKKQRKC